MRCVYCGEEFTGKAIRQDGEIYCSRSCADQAIGEEEYDDFIDYDNDDNDDNEEYRDVIYEEGFELAYYDE